MINDVNLGIMYPQYKKATLYIHEVDWRNVPSRRRPSDYSSIHVQLNTAIIAGSYYNGCFMLASELAWSLVTKKDLAILIKPWK